MVDLRWCKCGDVKHGRYNFGDVLTPYLYHALVGHWPSKRRRGKDGKRDTTAFVGAGSVLHSLGAGAVLWGTGSMGPKRLLAHQVPRRVLSVRGPLTRKVCISSGVPCPPVYGDIGLILPVVFDPDVDATFTVGVIPHYVDAKTMAHFASVPGLKVIDVLSGVEPVAAAIKACDAIVSTSLHGVIVAHAYSKPAAWARVSSNVKGGSHKYWDYYESVGVPAVSMRLKPLPRKVLDLAVSSETPADSLCTVVRAYPQPPQLPPPVGHILAACPWPVRPDLRTKFQNKS